MPTLQPVPYRSIQSFHPPRGITLLQLDALLRARGYQLCQHGLQLIAVSLH